jgi:hypothetical protein
MWRNYKGRAARDKEALMHDKQWETLYHVTLKMDTPPGDAPFPITYETVLKLIIIHQDIRAVLEETILPPIHDSLKLTNGFGKDRITKVITESEKAFKDINPWLGVSVQFLELNTKRDGRRCGTMFTRLHEGR